MFDAVEEIRTLKSCGITLNEISEELNYRDNASEGMRWDDNLYEYATGELEEIEKIWEENAA